ncbi:transforming growth factor-beta-induced protein ig-h3-like [Petromyzon marinus]|uniref:transforming growth factor-beta-induced protein ig-h3-like n=1 Tax=Petromyzon marinus TaxID=7757 RepID=UPI003F70AF4E
MGRRAVATILGIALCTLSALPGTADAQASHIDRLLLHSRIRGRAEGPNVCSVQMATNSMKTFYSSCQTWYRKMVCGNPTTITYECCPGYLPVEGEKGCPAILPLGTMAETLEAAGATTTMAHMEQADLGSVLAGRAAFTAFAPDDNAWKGVKMSESEIRDSMSYSLVDRRLLGRDLKHGMTLPTLKEDELHVHHFPNGIITVNCVRILKPNLLASNGVVHIVESIIPPASASIRAILESDSRLQTLTSALSSAGMLETVGVGVGPYTLFAPTDAAFEKLPKEMLARILADPVAVKALLQHHVVRAAVCTGALLGPVRHDSAEGSPLLLGCGPAGVTVDGRAVVEQADRVATNGIVHVLNELLLPDSAKSTLELMDDPDHTTFKDMFVRAGLKSSLREGAAYTLLAPTNKAFGGSLLSASSSELSAAMKNHVLKGSVQLHELFGGKALETLSGKKLRVFIYQKAICLENACVSPRVKHGQTSDMFSLDQVVRAPTKSLLDLLKADKRFSTLVGMVKTSGLTQTLNKAGSYTLFAPTNAAFEALPSSRLSQLSGSTKQQAEVLKFHVTNGVVVKGGVPQDATTFLTTLQGGGLELVQTRDGVLSVAGHDVVQEDLMATNGVIHAINSVLLPSESDSVTIKLVQGKQLVTRTLKKGSKFSVASTG